MPYDDPDPTDPMTLHGVAVETEDDTAVCEMAECFVEEYVRLGFDAGRIMRIFQTPGYAGPYMAYGVLGEAAIQNLVQDQMSLRRDRPSEPPTERMADGRIGLTVLQE